MYTFNIVLGLLDKLLELQESVNHESEAGEALNLISIQISKISNSSNFETFTAMALKLQEVANL